MLLHRRFGARPKSLINMSEGKEVFFVLGFLFVWVLVLLVPALANPFYLDDIPRIVDNPDLRSWSSLWSRLVFRPSDTALTFGNDPSRPLVFLLYGLIYQSFGPSPPAFHAINLVLHLLNALLLMFWINKISAWRTRAESIFLPMLAVMFFCLSPIQVGTVMYAYGLSDILVTTWFLLFLIVGWQKPVKLSTSILLSLILVLGLATKQVAAVFPIILMMQYVILPDSSTSRWWRLGLLFWLFLLVSAYVLGRQLYFGAIGDLEGRGEVKGLLNYLIIQPYVIWRYVGLSFFPFGLSIDHAPELDAINTSIWFVAYGFLLILIIVPLVLAQLRPSLTARFLCFLIVVFFVLLAPTSSFLPTVDYMVERRIYMANIATAAFLSLLGGVLKTHIQGWQKQAGYILAVIFFGLFSWINWQRVQLFSDPIAMWSDVRRLYPESARARRALGMVFFENKNLGSALQELQPLTSGHDYMSVVTVGSIYADMTSSLYNADLALEHYDRAQDLQPAMALAYFAKGKLLQNLQRNNEAMEQFLRALAIDPRHSDAHNNLGNIYFSQGQYDEAVQAFRRAWEFAAPIATIADFRSIRLQDAQDARIPMANLATAYATMGRYEDALAICQQALFELPDEPAFLGILGYLYGQKSWRFYDESRALEHLRKAAQGGQDYNAQFNLARKLHALGQIGEARQIYTELVKTAPKDVDARKNLALLEWQVGRYDSARQQLEAAIEVAPERPDLKRLIESLRPSLQLP